MNNVQLIGRLTANPEIRTTLSGTDVCSFTLAVTRKHKSEGQQEADFIRCVSFGNTASIISKYVLKGERLAITGRIATRNYDNENGDKVYVTEVVVDSVYFVETKKSENKKEESDPVIDFNDELEINDDDLPF